MKTYVITLTQLEDSVKSAERVVASGREHGIEAVIFEGVPKTISRDRMVDAGIRQSTREDETGNVDAMIGCFMSHFSLWERCVEDDEPILVLEHDAYFVAPINESVLRGHCCVNLGRPYYGRLKRPFRFKFFAGALSRMLGGGGAQVFPLFSSNHLPGTHAYYVEPSGARKLISQARDGGLRPADLYMNSREFPFLEEIYPWPIEARPHFTSIGEGTAPESASLEMDDGEFRNAKEVWKEVKS